MFRNALAFSFISVFGTIRILFWIKQLAENGIFWGMMGFWVGIAWAVFMWLYFDWSTRPETKAER